MVVEGWKPPEEHPISIERAKELMAGDLADVYRDILRRCCAPIFWLDRQHHDRGILGNGTITFVQTPERLLGITAAHVWRGYEEAAADSDLLVRIGDCVIADLADRRIDVSDRLDLATFGLDAKVMEMLGEEKRPLEYWPPRAPEEGRGIMLAGFPAVARQEADNAVSFGLFTALAIARTVTDLQITWLIEPDAQLEAAQIPPPPPQYGLGGVSGGPLITWLETESHIATYVLGGIIAEHPDYEGNEFSIERVVARRADLILASGRIIAAS
jgi:hypothetical protein